MKRAILLSILLAAFSAPAAPAQGVFQLNSPAFSQGQPIPRAYTAEGAGHSPPLHWSGLPEKTAELALIMDDPDAPGGTFVHWVLYGITPDLSGIPESRSIARGRLRAPLRAEQGVSSAGSPGYYPPSPPRGDSPHHYHFKLYALDKALKLPPGLTAAELEKRISGHVRAETELVGSFGR